MSCNSSSTNLKTAFNTLTKILNSVNDSYYKILEEFLLSETVKEYSQKKAKMLKTYHLDETEQFCFFETISDKYYYEKFHSDILRIILNPLTPKIGNIEFLKNFLKNIEVDEKDFIVDRSTEVVTEQYTENSEEKGYIDIIIRNSEGKVIIIENKINDAEDQPNQLARYVQYAKKQNYEVVKVVYLIKINEERYCKVFNNLFSIIEKYDRNYSEEKKFLQTKNNLTIRAAVTSNTEEKSLVSFVDDCIDCSQIDQNLTAKIYLEQYKILLQHIGGNVYMSEPNKELIKSIYSDKEKLQSAVDFAEFWNNKQKREEILYTTIKELISEQLESLEFESFIEDNISGLRKDFGDFYICFYIQIPERQKDDWDCGIGFLRHKFSDTKRKEQLKQEQLKELLEKAKTIKGFNSEIYDGDSDWVCRQINLNEIDRNKVLLSNLVKDIVDRLEYLDKEYSKIS